MRDSAKAAIDKATEMGVTDPERVGVGGHSYGAFMTANLLAHEHVDGGAVYVTDCVGSRSHGRMAARSGAETAGGGILAAPGGRIAGRSRLCQVAGLRSRQAAHRRKPPGRSYSRRFASA